MVVFLKFVFRLWNLHINIRGLSLSLDHIKKKSNSKWKNNILMLYKHNTVIYFVLFYCLISIWCVSGILYPRWHNLPEKQVQVMTELLIYQRHLASTWGSEATKSGHTLLLFCCFLLTSEITARCIQTGHDLFKLYS